MKYTTATEAMHALEVLLAMFFKNFEDLRGRYTVRISMESLSIPSSYMMPNEVA